MMLRTSLVTVTCAIAVTACGGGAAHKAHTPPARAIATSICGPVSYGGTGRPTALVAVVGPLQGQIKAHGLQNAQSAKLVLARYHWRAGDQAVGLQVCDEADPRTSAASPAKCRRIARAVAAEPSVLGMVGPEFSSCAREMLPILNRARGGPVGVISPSNTYLGLTRSGPGVAPGDPAGLYPTGRRNYARIAPADDVQAAAGVVFAGRLGVHRPYVLHDGEIYGDGLASAYATAARRSGMAVAGVARWAPPARDYVHLARRVRAAGADGIFLGGFVFNNGPRLIRDLRDAVGPGVPIVAPDGFNQPSAIVEGAGAGADGVALTIASPPVRVLPDAGRAYAAEFERRFSQRPCCYAVHAAEATGIMLDAIGHTDGKRGQVTENLLRTEVKHGLLGQYAFDRYGDTTLTTMAVYRIRGGALRYAGSVSPPRSLLARR